MIKKFIVVLLLIILIPQSASAAESAMSSLLQKLDDALTALSQVVSAAWSDSQVLGAEIIVVRNDEELLQALMSVRGGETIALAPVVFGEILVQRNQYPRTIVGSSTKIGVTGNSPALAAPVRITSQLASNRAVVRSLKFVESDKWQIDNLIVFPFAKKVAVELGGDNMKFTKNIITYGDSTQWVTNQDWYNNVSSAIGVSGDNIEVGFNLLTGIGFGISVGYSADDAYIHHNMITDYSGDAMRGLGTNGRFEHNIIKNATVADSNHDDAFQSWAYDPVTKKVGGGVSTGNQVRYNTITYSDTAHPLRVSTQGIGLFDGPFKDWVIENNLVVVDHYHGISMYGAIDSTIKNNVVVDPNTTKPGPVWVKFFNKKDGTPPSGARLIGNYSNNKFGSSSATVVSEGNVQVPFSDYSKYFVNPASFNFTPKSGAFPFSVGSQLRTTDLPSMVNYATVLTPASVSGSDTVTSPVINPPVDTSSVLTTPTIGSGGTDLPTVPSNTVELVWFGVSSAAGISSTTAVGVVVRTQQVVSEVRFYLNGVLVNTDTIKPFRMYNSANERFDTATYTPGSYRIRAEAVIDGMVVSKEAKLRIASSTTAVTNDVSPADGIDTSTTTSRVITTDRVFVRTEPAGQVITVVPAASVGNMYTASSTVNGNAWHYVDFDRQPDGYVARAYLQVLRSTAPAVQSILTQIETLKSYLNKLKSEK